MRRRCDRHPEAVRAVGRMVLPTVVLVALTITSSADGTTGLAGPVVLMIGGFAVVAWQQVQLRRPSSRMAQRQLLAQAFSTMRIPPEADRALWRRWLQPIPSPPDDRWSLIENGYLGLLLAVLVVVQFSIDPLWGMPIAVALPMLAVGLSRWVSRREKQSPWADSDRAYLLAQLDAPDRPRGS